MKTNNLKKYYFLVITVLLLIFFHFLGWLTPAQNFIRYLFKPVLQKSTLVRTTTEDNDLIKLQQTNINLLAQLKIAQQENEILKKMLEFKNKSALKLITAAVVGRNFDLTDQTVIINVGIEQGVNIGDVALSGEGILIGKIIQTEKNTSIIRLLNDNQSKIAVTILNNDKSLGIIQGGYGLSIKMLFIPRNEIIKVGDVVVTSGLEKNIPKGLVIGVVEAVENEANQPFQQAIITPAQNLGKITFVSVLKIQ